MLFLRQKTVFFNRFFSHLLVKSLFGRNLYNFFSWGTPPQKRWEKKYDLARFANPRTRKPENPQTREPANPRTRKPENQQTREPPNPKTNKPALKKEPSRPLIINIFYKQQHNSGIPIYAPPPPQQMLKQIIVAHTSAQKSLPLVRGLPPYW